jgi:hypothetical protein
MSITYPGHDATHVGVVLDTHEENRAHDSYFHATFWDGEKITSVETHSTAYGGPWPTVTIDATQDVINAALAWYRAKWLESAIRNTERIHAEVTFGKRVRSTTTRGKNVGVEGLVRRCIANTFSSNDDAMRVQIELDNGETRWMDAHRTEVVDPAPVDVDALAAQSRMAMPARWSCATTGLAYAMTR